MVLREDVRVSEEFVRRLEDPAQGSCLEAAASRWVEGARARCREKERVRTWDALRQTGVPGIALATAAPSAEDSPRPECVDALLAGAMGMPAPPSDRRPGEHPLDAAVDAAVVRAALRAERRRRAKSCGKVYARGRGRNEMLRLRPDYAALDGWPWLGAVCNAGGLSAIPVLGMSKLVRRLPACGVQAHFAVWGKQQGVACDRDARGVCLGGRAVKVLRADPTGSLTLDPLGRVLRRLEHATAQQAAADDRRCARPLRRRDIGRMGTRAREAGDRGSRHHGHAMGAWPRRRRRCGSAPGGISALFVWSCKGRVAHRRTYPGRFAARTLCVRVPPAGATTIDVAVCGSDASNDDDAPIAQHTVALWASPRSLRAVGGRCAAPQPAREETVGVVVDVCGREDALRGVIKALGVPAVEACHDLLGVMSASCCTAASMLNTETRVAVLRPRAADILRRVWSGALTLACGRRMCHIVAVLPPESLAVASTLLPLLDLSTDPSHWSRSRHGGDCGRQAAEGRAALRGMALCDPVGCAWLLGHKLLCCASRCWWL
ncbi:hypothetical protein CGC20_3940 [Leishmania donovani]|uniref:Uncharacterized protein n=1 Tax=Leishmania donovani TaxID=5661 RepID=A0A504X0R1_LEIDO|nr:hypothetical protein CGC20_3940 [Leishmania donovani]